MAHETHLRAAGPVCAEAVQSFASEVAKATPFSPVVTTADTAEAVAFLEATTPAIALRVEWTRRRREGLETTSEWEENEEAFDADEFAEVPEHSVRHYARTMAALAGNPEAAGAFLKETKAQEQQDRRRSSPSRSCRRKKKGKTHGNHE